VRRRLHQEIVTESGAGVVMIVTSAVTGIATVTAAETGVRSVKNAVAAAGVRTVRLNACRKNESARSSVAWRKRRSVSGRLRMPREVTGL